MAFGLVSQTDSGTPLDCQIVEQVFLIETYFLKDNLQ